jgi:urocanate reductase
VDGHVLNPEGDPIPSLYAAGMCTGSFAEQAGLFYPGGVAQSLAFGRQAGTNAAAEKAWE